MKTDNILISLFPLVLGLSCTVLIATGQSDDLSMKKALTFYASFDSGTDADISRGDKRLFTLIGKEPKLGNKTEGMSRIVKGKGLQVMLYYLLSAMLSGYYMMAPRIFHLQTRTGAAAYRFG